MKDATEISGLLKTIIEDVTFGNKTAAQLSDDDQLLLDAGLDSLDYATVLFTAEQNLGIKVDESSANWSELVTIRQLAEFLARNQ